MSTPGKDRPGTRFGLRPLLVASIGALVLIAVGTVAGVSYYSSRSVAGGLGSRAIVTGLDRLERALRDELDAAVQQARVVSEAITAGKLSFETPEPLLNFAAGALAATPQVSGVILVDDKLKAVELRSERGYVFRVDVDISDSPVLSKVAREAPARPGPYWISSMYSDRLTKSVLGFVVPIRYEKRHLGFIVVYIRATSLSAFADRLSDPPRITAFILYGGAHVLAHPSLTDDFPQTSPDHPLPELNELEDPVLPHLAEARPYREAGITLPRGYRARTLRKDGRRYYIYERSLGGYGDAPLVIGRYYTARYFDQIVATLRKQALIGVALLIVAVALAIVLARALSQPIRKAAAGAAAFRALDFDRIAALERSPIKEIDELAVSLDAAKEGLTSFGRYVPRTLVARLIKEGRSGAGSEERALSVMFTDIAGFSAMCEEMSAKEVADFINGHFTLLADCIEEQGGTIDKYIGDAVMAFWGAPDRLENTALPACRAALAILTAIAEDNAVRAAQGLPPVRLRIGIHTGPLVVGDIGAPTRTNYTVVGDVVNGAQRLEALGEEVDPEAEVIILISRATADLLPPDFDIAAQGAFKVKGKETELEVFRLA